MKLAFRLAWRELRGGVRGLRIVLACLALGVAAFQDLGLDLAEARERALLAYAAYAGYFQLLRTTPGAVTAVTDLSGYVRRLAEALVPAKGPRL